MQRALLIASVTVLSTTLGCGAESDSEAVAAAPDAGKTDAPTDTALVPDLGPDVLDAVADVDTPDVLVEAEAEAAHDAGPLLGCIEGDFQPYFGNLHAHTRYSDGEGIPADAFEHSRTVAGLDVMVVTDHLEQLYWPDPFDRYGKCNEQADNANDPGSFVAACGFEYGSGFSGVQSTGHNNVFFSDHLFPAVQTDYHSFYGTLVACAGCIGQFNHPGDEPKQTWSDFTWNQEVDQRINLFEFNGGGDVWNLFFQALDAGWHISPVFNQDNHSADWGSRNDNRSGLYMPFLSRTGLYDAMINRRTFLSYDDVNATIRLMAGGTCWMGSILGNASTVPITLEAADPDSGDGFATLLLYGPGQAILHEQDCGGESPCTAALDITVTEPTYVVGRAFQSDGGELVSAPIWLSP